MIKLHPRGFFANHFCLHHFSILLFSRADLTKNNNNNQIHQTHYQARIAKTKLYVSKICTRYFELEFLYILYLYIPAFIYLNFTFAIAHLYLSVFPVCPPHTATSPSTSSSPYYMHAFKDIYRE